MNRLSILSFGAFEVHLDGVPVSGIESDKTRALLVYLAVHADRMHRRDTLAALLWPESSAASARQNLRQALYNLREALGDQRAAQPFLIADRQSVRFNPASNYWLDASMVQALISEPPEGSQLTADACIMRWEQAVQLYQGQFLDGFTLADAEPFEEWRMFRQEELHRRLMSALTQLATRYEAGRHYAQAQRCLQRQLELEPWCEETHRALMRVLSKAGHRASALQQFASCRWILDRELGVEPAIETQTLYEHIKSGGFPSLSNGTPPCVQGASSVLPI